MDASESASSPVRVAVEGCGHGCLNDIYASVQSAAALKGWDSVDLVIIGGDFQAVRNSSDIACMSVPRKFKAIGDFHEYYSGARIAPYLTIFVGGNHEASNYLFELYYGGWVAPNIYYLGAANLIRYGPLRIAGMSGIFKSYDYRKSHHERLPYNRDDIQSVYHVRELDVRKLLQVRTQIDVCLSHDWPRQVEYSGNYKQLFKVKPGIHDDSARGKLGSPAAKHVFDRLRPAYWFASHMHVKFAAAVQHGKYILTGPRGKEERAFEFATQRQQAGSLGLDDATMTSPFPKDKEAAYSSCNLNKVPTESSNLDIGASGYPADNSIHSGSLHAKCEEGPATSKASSALGPYASPSNSSESQAVHWSGFETVGTGGTQCRLSAWNNFHVEALQREKAENALLLEKPTSASQSLEIQHSLIWKRIGTDPDGLNRTVVGSKEPEAVADPVHKKQKTQHPSDYVRNEDEIDLGSDSSSDCGLQVEGTIQTKDTSKAEAPKAAASNFECAVDEESDEKRSKQNHTDVPDDTFEDLRSQLPASFARPVLFASPVNGPLPESITNKTTYFLALDKCLPGRDFLQLIELRPVSKSNKTAFNRPYRLEYDKEWLAITRVFASSLQLGDPSAKPPADKGDTAYKPEIEKAEQWVEENIVKPGKLAIPDNFAPVAPFYDPAVPITTEEQPPEYVNPQTSKFCELIGIDNKFHLSDDEREARMVAGPRPCGSRDNGLGPFPGRSPGGKRGGGYGQRYRGSGRGRGRGRGRGWQGPRS